MICPVCQSVVTDSAYCQACGASLLPGPGTLPFYAPEALTPGTPLHGGEYVIDAVLGRGGFGITYLARDCESGSHVAIKEFFPAGCYRDGLHVQPPSGEQDDFDSARSKFAGEIQILSRIDNPHVVRVFGSFEENNTVYLVMAYLRGKTLLQLVTEKGALPEAEAVKYIEQIGEAVDAIHQLGLLHRDLKPGNMMKCDNGRVVLFDFGTARAFESGKTVGMTAQLTPGYAPLEQYGQHARFGVYTDIYSLGATLYHLLTGDPPVPASDRATGVPLPPPEQVNPYVTHVVSAGVMWAMEMRVEQRPQSMEELVTALARAHPRPSPASRAVEGDVDDAKVRADGDQATLTTRRGEDGNVLVLSRFDVVWPRRCVTCGNYTERTMRVEMARQVWNIPYCNSCSEKKMKNDMAPSLAMLLVLVFPFYMVLRIYMNPLLATAAFVLVGPTMAFLFARFENKFPNWANRLVRVYQAVWAEPRGREVVMRFKDPQYCEDFRKLNARAMADGEPWDSSLL